MRSLALAIGLLLLPGTSLAQRSQKLHYFLQNSRVGVKNKEGNVVIPAKYPNFSYEHNDAIPDDEQVIALMDTVGRTRNIPAVSYGDAYNREGHFLYHPAVFDNGPDYTNEGLTRCVAQGKVGFADAMGNIVIQPQWDWTGTFNYGYAFVCTGCYFDYGKDAEHPDLAFHPGADTGYINSKGQRIKPEAQPRSVKDQKVNGGYLPYPFVYTPAEQKLVDSFNATEVLGKVAFMNYYSKPEDGTLQLRFELLERPSVRFPYYLLQGYEYSGATYTTAEQMVFMVDKQGNWFHRNSWERKLVSYQRWLKQELVACDDFFKTHPDAPNKFDTRPYRKK